jgi:hypothetical protein
MKRLITAAILLAFIVSTISMGCDSNLLLRATPFEYTNFTNVQVGGPFKLEVTRSDSYSIQVLERIKVEQSGNTLKINADWGGILWAWGMHVQPVIKISMPVLSILDLSGACNSSVRSFRSNENFKLVLSGASTADIDLEGYDASFSLTGASRVTGNIKGRNTRLNLSGASTARLSGNGYDLNVQASGASTADLAALSVNDVRIDLSGASNAKVLPSGHLDAFLSGASILEYGGSANLGIVQVSGGSTINHL